MSDNENTVERIAAAVKSGDYSEFASLVKLCVFVPKNSLFAARRLGFEYEDLRQEGIVALLYALHSYNPAGGAGFRTYSSLCIQRRIISVLRSATRSKHLSMADYVPIEEICAVAEEQDWMRDVELRDIKERLFRRLSPMESEVFRMYLGGLSYREIADRLCKTEKSVSNALGRIKGKLLSEL